MSPPPTDALTKGPTGDVSNFLQGIGNGATLGLTGQLRDALTPAYACTADQSGFHTAGSVTGAAATLALPGAGVAQVSSRIADTGELLASTGRIGTEIDSRAVSDLLDGLPQGKQPPVRQVESSNDLRSLFDDLTRNGTRATQNYKGNQYDLPDGSWIGLRPASRNGDPAIDISRPGTLSAGIRKVHTSR